MTTTYTLQYVGKILSKKNRHIVARIGGRTAVLPDMEAKKNETDIAMQFSTQMRQDENLRHKTYKDKTWLVMEAERASATYEIEITITQADGIRRDLDNQTSTLMDALVKAGAIPDDCRKFVRKITVIDGGVNKEQAGAIITIQEQTN